MVLPTINEFLESLYRMKRECAVKIAEAESRGDLKEARTFQMQIRKINSLIQKKGGDVHA